MTASPVPPEPGGWQVTSGSPDPAAVERLLRSLPDWFGIESSTAEYIRRAAELPAYLAWRPGQVGPPATPAAVATPAAASGSFPAGALLAIRHFPAAAEIYLMAVDPAAHRRGAGRALVTAAERDLAADGVRFLQVKTLGSSHPDLGYARTRAFYLALGFEPLEEITGLWPENPCLIMIKSLA
ncbi:MAG TPA: GNAT family N-acetyltransferase [Streptosporangiaceae bacterium]